MERLTDLFSRKPRTFSFELFPPHTTKGHERLWNTVEALTRLGADFASCTYGAGGGRRDQTLDIVRRIQEDYGLPGLAHLTCVCHSRREIREILDELKRNGIRNVLALRGDPPRDRPDWTPGPDDFHYSHELCAYIRDRFDDWFSIGVAGFPEGHPQAPDRTTDRRFLKQKIDSGADFVITQLFFRNRDYFDYIAGLRELGVTARVIPGVLPITDYDALLRFCGLCGATIPEEVHRLFGPLRGDPRATLDAGIAFALDQCRELLAGGAPGLHFYCLNKPHPTDVLLEELRSVPPPVRPSEPVRS